MIRIIGRGVAQFLLQLATTLVIIAVVCLGLSAWVAARMIGVQPRFSRSNAAMGVVRDALALAIDAKRQLSKDPPA